MRTRRLRPTIMYGTEILNEKKYRRRITVEMKKKNNFTNKEEYRRRINVEIKNNMMLILLEW